MRATSVQDDQNESDLPRPRHTVLLVWPGLDVIHHGQGSSGLGCSFTDESTFTLFRLQGERFHDACVRKHDRYGGRSLMVCDVPSDRDDILQPLVLPALQAVDQDAAGSRQRLSPSTTSR